MKTRSKALLLTLCAVLLVAASVLGTMAYLTSTDSVKNTFTVGHVKIELDEAKVGTDGKALTGDSAARVDKNTYKLMPGHMYDKDPTVTVVGGSEESYIKMVVTVNKADQLDLVFASHANDFTLVADKGAEIEGVISGYDSTKWILQGEGGEKDAEGNRTYTFYYYKTVSALEKDAEGKYKDVVLEDLFTGINVPGCLSNTEFDTLSGLEITVKAYAIQADGFKSADAAWDAYPAN